MEDRAGVARDDGFDHGRIGEIARNGAHTRVAHVRGGDDVEQDELRDRLRSAAGAGQGAARENLAREAASQESRAAGDDDSHGCRFP